MPNTHLVEKRSFTFREICGIALDNGQLIAKRIFYLRVVTENPNESNYFVVPSIVRVCLPLQKLVIFALAMLWISQLVQAAKGAFLLVFRIFFSVSTDSIIDGSVKWSHNTNRVLLWIRSQSVVVIII